MKLILILMFCCILVNGSPFKTITVQCDDNFSKLTDDITIVNCPAGCKNEGGPVNDCGGQAYDNNSPICKSAIKEHRIKDEGGKVTVLREKRTDVSSASRRKRTSEENCGNSDYRYMFMQSTTVSKTFTSSQISTSKCPFYCDFAPTVSNGGSVTPTLPAPPGYHGNTVVTSSCANGFESTSGFKTSECSATNTWTPASLSCTDINECGHAGSCQVNVACYNTKGSFTCGCNSGYSADGICIDCYAGVKDGRVKDAQMTASSSVSDNTPSKGRLDGSSYWFTHYSKVGEWLQVDFLGNKTIYGVVTQGSDGTGLWVSKFEIQYSNDGTNFQSIKEGSTAKIFEGNVGAASHKVNRFQTPITAQYFRLVSKSSPNSYPYLRLEYFTC